MIDEDIERCIRENPGMHFSGISRKVGAATGQLQHHLRKLVEDRKVVSEKISGRRHYFPPEFKKNEMKKIAFLRRETKRDVLITLIQLSGGTPQEVADTVGIARSTAEHHIDDLEEVDLVEKRYGDGRVYLEPNVKEAVELLDVVDPSSLDRAVDRFTRIFDDFLDI